MSRDLKPKRSFPLDWSTIEQSGTERILCFDQSLLNTGWALMMFSPGKVPSVLIHGTIHTPPIPGLSGMVDSFLRGESLLQEISNVLTVVWEMGFDCIVHETPSLMGFGGQSKMEAAPIAAMALRSAIRQHQVFKIRQTMVDMLQAEVVQAWIGGRRGAKKEEIHAEMWRIIPEFRTNEHVRDAIALGLTYVARRDLDIKVDAWRERTGRTP
jgi:Holliday junction resolvasome RuvABC endonuclease subunit